MPSKKEKFKFKIFSFLIVQVSIYISFWNAQTQHLLWIRVSCPHDEPLFDIFESISSWTAFLLMLLSLVNYFQTLFWFNVQFKHTASVRILCRCICWRMIYLQTSRFNSSLSSAVSFSFLMQTSIYTNGSNSSFVQVKITEKIKNE